jgi:hypothetical protein
VSLLSRVVCAYITVRLLGGQHMRHDDEQAVSDRQSRFAFASSPGQAMRLALRAQCSSYDCYCNHLQAGRSAHEQCPWWSCLRDACLRAGVLPGPTPAHEARWLAEGKRLLSTPLSERRAAAASCLHAGNAQEQLLRLLKWAEPVLELQLEMLNTVFQRAHVSKALPKQHVVLRLALAVQRLLELAKFVTQRATSPHRPALRHH